ncbi:amino acid adenylation domain-containing protein [Streptomyces kanamyceticus]|uniref:Non-ribosomal peptide synthase n=1 Tax=Streptomyces kanamyceticus TaxID=1967 RepID=A0A5J6G2M8_STRKN|nr:amino acid adenylation domain-containing protein [Streptomyces kanamyceticus]QEU89840.1 non-ribosomal peptide synthase [Streptomyces kanamyceticus]
MTRQAGPASFPLTDVQHAYLLGRQDGLPLGGIGCHMSFEFDQTVALDPSRLAVAYQRLQERHVSLRSAFADPDQATPCERVPGQLAVRDLASATLDAVTCELGLVREQVASQRLDVARGQVTDLRLTLLPGGGSRLHVDIDLLAADPPAIRVLLDELAALYEGETLPAPGDFGRCRSALQDTVAVGDTGPCPPLAAPRLPYAMEPEDLAGPPRFTRREVALPAPAWRSIQEMARMTGVRAESVLFAAFVATLKRFDVAPDTGFALNLPVFDRPQDTGVPATCTLGDFSRLLAVAVPAREPCSLKDLALWADRALQADAPTVAALREAARRRGEAAPPLGVVYTALERSWASARCEAVIGPPVWMVSHTPQVWLDCLAYPSSDAADSGMVLAWDAVDDVFRPGVLDGMTEYCGEVLTAYAGRDWDAPPTDRLPEKQHEARRRTNDTWAPPSGALLHQHFFESAAREPRRLCLHHDGNSLSRGELRERALRLAGELKRRGLRAREPVGVCLTSGEAQVVSVLAVLAAGGCYVPVSPEQPARRLEQVLRVSGARYSICDDDVPGSGDGPAPVAWHIALDTSREPLAHPVHSAPDDPAYIIFTSGSTGTPKGVEVSHRSAVNTLEDLNRRWDVGPMDGCLSVSALDFDLSVYEIFGLLMAGGHVVMPNTDERRDPEAWLRLILAHRVTVWDSVPVLLDMLLTAGELGTPPDSLRLVLTGGDWIGTDLPGRLRRLAPECRFVACGGATEGAVYSNFFEVEETDPTWTSIPYGTPLRNQSYRAVDRRGRDCPDWVPGELWIGGTGVALGYRGDPQRTAERFVEYDGQRWYRTGDLGRYRSDGTLEFLGRADHQIKLNGYRIELGEIENVLGTHHDVDKAAAVLAGEGPRRRIVVFLLPREDSMDMEDVRAHAGRWLPAYARPADYLLLPELPRNANGKIDRKQLIAWAAPQQEAVPQEPPLPGTEEALCQEWTRLLGSSPRSRHDSFFGLGADSLLTMRLSLAVKDRFGVRVPLRRLQAAATLAAMARAIDDAPDAVPQDAS